ncbi:MAG: alanine racemase [Bradymonadia bacterium]
MRSQAATELAATCGGQLYGSGDAVGERVVTDTRGAVRRGDVFVALCGEHFDAGEFVRDAFEAGASIVVTERHVEPAEGAALIVVPDALAALQMLATAERRAFGGRVVAITGSNGKTTVKDMIAAGLAGSTRVWASPMSYNSQVGVALSLLSIDPQASVALVECGISLPGEMRRLAAMVRPDFGIFVNVSEAHIEGLGSLEQTAEEKSALFAEMQGWCVVPEHDALAISALKRRGVGLELVPDAAWPSFSGVLGVDAALALRVCALLGADSTLARRGLSSWTPAPMRLEISETPRGVVVINDAYTSDPGSTASALAALVRDGSDGCRFAVLGGMAQQGAGRQEANFAVGERVVELGVNVLIGVGPGGAEIVEGARAAGMPSANLHALADVREAGKLLASEANAGDRVLLKGARPQRLERIAPQLYGALSPARAYIDLDGVVDNFRAVQRTAGVPVMCVVKSFGYGLNARRIGVALERAGASAFCVAYPDEGVELREAGVTGPILVQNVVPSDAEKLTHASLDVEIGDLSQLAAVADHEREAPINVHLKVDTGMGRAGVSAAGAPALAAAITRAGGLRIRALMTHLAAADEPEHDAYTRSQLAEFRKAIEAVEDAGHAFEWVHAANSAAAARFPEARHSMVRAGISLLGYGSPEIAELTGTRPVLRLVTRVISVKTVEEGAFIGYGLTYQTDVALPVALIAIGYGDGYPRALSNRGWVTIDGTRCPIVGRVCMDVTMVDVSAVRREVRPGDEVVIYGPGVDEPNLVELSQLADTIPYELLTRLTARVRRIYGSQR